jgi:hypothetical protein
MTDDTETKTRHEVTTMKIKDALTSSAAALTPAEDDPFETYADAALANDIVGTVLKFSKGDYLAGPENRQIGPSARRVGNMDSFSVGYVRWSSGGPTETVMGRVVDRFVPPRRSDLGDNDPDLWEADDKGEPRDPWRFTVKLVLADPETGELFTFATSSKGGRRALDKLCQAYGRERARHPDEWPVVELQVDSYQHPNKAYGRIKFPVFKIVGWIAKGADISTVWGSPPPPNPPPAMVAAPLSDMDEPPTYDSDDPGIYDPPF